jgi:hypothetical protein
MKQYIITRPGNPDQQLCRIDGELVFLASHHEDILFFSYEEDAISFASTNLPLETPEEEFFELYKIETVFGLHSKKLIKQEDQNP